MKSGRRQFLGGIGSLGLFSWFEKRVMEEVGVAAPTDVQPQAAIWGVYLQEKLLALCLDKSFAEKMACFWTFDCLADSHQLCLTEVSKLSVPKIKRLLEKLGILYDVEECDDEQLVFIESLTITTAVDIKKSLYPGHVRTVNKRPSIEIVQELLNTLKFSPLKVKTCEEAHFSHLSDYAEKGIAYLTANSKSEAISASDLDIISDLEDYCR